MEQTEFLLRQRISEIRNFRKFVSCLEVLRRDQIRELFNDASDHNRSRRVLYSQFIIMHYSLVEAIVTQAVTESLNLALFSKPKVSELKVEFLQYLVRCKLKQLKDQDFSIWVTDIASIVSSCADEVIMSISESETRSMWPGNLDARKIRKEILDRFGFEFDGSRNRNGSDLLGLKNERNDLTHGIKSWESVGQDYSWPQLRGISNRVVMYMIKFIKAFRAGNGEKFWLLDPPVDQT